MKILLAIDDSAHSQAAIDMLIAHRRPGDVEVLVLTVVEWALSTPDYAAFGVGREAIQSVLDSRDRALAAAQEYVTRVAAQLTAAGFSATATVREGPARSAILAVAGAWGADLVLMGSHGRRGLARYALGSVAEGVLHGAACSVEIVRLVPAAKPHVATEAEPRATRAAG